MDRPPKFQLVDLKLGGELEAWLAEQRQADASYDAIARDIWDRTGVSVTGATVRNWCVEYTDLPATEGAA